MKTQTNHKAIILTGGPGMGKTSIIENVEKLGYPCVQESGRYIIQAEVKAGGDKLPWKNQHAYAMEMYKMALIDYEKALTNEVYTFFDRGIPDVIGYLILCKLAVPDEVWSVARTHRYCEHVFITPPWQEIYRIDDERKQSFEEAEATYKVMANVYTDLGYSLIEIPKVSVQERVAFVLDSIK